MEEENCFEAFKHVFQKPENLLETFNTFAGFERTQLLEQVTSCEDMGRCKNRHFLLNGFTLLVKLRLEVKI